MLSLLTSVPAEFHFDLGPAAGKANRSGGILPGEGTRRPAETHTETGPLSQGKFFHLNDDPGERRNLALSRRWLLRTANPRSGRWSQPATDLGTPNPNRTINDAAA